MSARHPLGQESIEVLEMALRYGATRIDLTDESLRLFQGNDIVGDVDAPEGAVARIREDLRGCGVRGANAIEVTVQSPLGPLSFTAQITPTVTRLTFPVDPAEARAAALFSKVMGRMQALGCDRAQFSPASFGYHRGSELMEGGLSFDYGSLYEYGRRIGNVAVGQHVGHAFLASADGSMQQLRIELRGESVTFVLV